MNWTEAIHIPFALLGLLGFIIDQWAIAVKVKGLSFNWGIFIGRNLPTVVWNIIGAVVLAGIAANSELQLSIMESFMCGFMGGSLVKNRYKKNENQGNPGR